MLTCIKGNTQLKPTCSMYIVRNNECTDETTHKHFLFVLEMIMKSTDGIVINIAAMNPCSKKKINQLLNLSIIKV
jgi:uncharacterized membrane protein (UPF0127 family)